MKIGLLTGGGDCPGLNAVIRAVVRTANQHFGFVVMGIEDGYEGLLSPMKVRPLGLEDVKGIVQRADKGDPNFDKIAAQLHNALRRSPPR